MTEFSLYDSFYNNDWAHSWIIIAGGIVLYILILFLMPEKYHYKGRRRIPFNYAVTISVLVVATFIFLVMEIVYNMHYSGIIFQSRAFYFLFRLICPTSHKPEVRHMALDIFNSPLLYVPVSDPLSQKSHTVADRLASHHCRHGCFHSSFVFAYNKKHRLSERINEYRSRKDTEVTESE